MAWTTTELLTSIKERGSIPTDQNRFSDTTLLTYADEETISLLLPAILAKREEWLTYDYDHSITSGQTSYRIPPRAYGGKVRLVSVVDASGNITYPARITPEQVAQFSSVNQTGSIPERYRVKHGSLVIEPSPNATQGTLRLTYYRRPSALVAAASLPTITVINTSTRVVTTSGAHGFTTSSVLDLVRAKPEFDSLAIDQTPTAVGSATTLTFASLPTDLAVGDYVVTAQTTPIPQIPADAQPILSQMVANRCLLQMGFMNEYKAGVERLAMMLEGAGIVLGTRDEGSSLKVTPKLGSR